jgi:5'-methylthioadenosine phosphorylase
MSIIGIIGGSGLYDIEGLTVTNEHMVKTPFGEPSDVIMEGELEGKRVFFLPRHGRGHVYHPHEINYRANFYALKSLGVERVIAASAVGSMREEIHPGDIVIVDQFIDRTKMRHQTFFEKGFVAHVPFADPVCPHLKAKLMEAGKAAGVTIHEGGTYVCIEGPMFSTRAESNVYRSWNTTVIGMTNYQEAKLAREAEICYATMALVTDYDCWHEAEEDVDVAKILETMNNNIFKAKNIIKKVLPTIDKKRSCHCADALRGGILTKPDYIPEETKKKLAPIVGKYVK